MTSIITQQLIDTGISASDASMLLASLQQIFSGYSGETAWQKIVTELLNSNQPFTFHLLLFSLCYPNWREQPQASPAWIPSAAFVKTTHLAKCMAKKNMSSVAEFQQWSADHPADFWQFMMKQLNIIFTTQPTNICDTTHGVEQPNWLVGAAFNIVDSCLKAAPNKIAILQQKKNGPLETFTYGDLDRLTNRIANSLIKLKFKPGDAIAIDMPMNKDAVAIYLGIIKTGCIVVSIADSFSSDEIASRLRIANAKAIFTQDVILRDGKAMPLYAKVIAANAPTAIVLANDHTLSQTLRDSDLAWSDFLMTNETAITHLCDAKSLCNILFSSGTTGDPKAIPWTHTTAIKAASDAYLHQNIHPNDILAWPTNLGWMMGPWLIFAALMNDAAIALYDDVPRGRDFGQFIQDAKVTMLGVVPTLVAAWRQSNCMQHLNWQAIRCFSSTGECSNPEDMLYLMSLAGYKPIIEYCGGTEIGGAYITSTMIEKNYPSLFTTPAFGLDFVLLDEQGQLTENGEVALIPPSIGLSLNLLNFNHHEIYFAGMPKTPNGKILRRHSDQVQRLTNNRYRILGRVDDTMNLGAIKVSSAEIERVLAGIEHIIETAAIAVNLNHHGPSCLVIVAATRHKLEKEQIKKMMQTKINQHLNPLFKIHDVVLLSDLPKTASNKIMRRVLRKQYQEGLS